MNAKKMTASSSSAQAAQILTWGACRLSIFGGFRRLTHVSVQMPACAPNATVSKLSSSPDRHSATEEPMDAQFDMLLRGGRVIDPASGHDGVADIGVRDGVIAAIEPAIPAETARQVLDVAGKIVTAGMIDTHAHV